MKEKLKTNYEKYSMDAAKDTILALKKGDMIAEAKKIALEAIDDWEQENKHELVEKFKKWLREQEIILDKVE